MYNFKLTRNLIWFLLANQTTYGFKNKIKSVWKSVWSNRLKIQGIFQKKLLKRKKKRKEKMCWLLFLLQLLLNCYTTATARIFYINAAPCYSVPVNLLTTTERKWKCQGENNPSQHVTLQTLLSHAWLLTQGVSVDQGRR